MTALPFPVGSAHVLLYKHIRAIYEGVLMDIIKEAAFL